MALSPASGTGNGAVTLTASTGSLTAGSYSGSVTVSATGATPVTIPVAFTVTPAPVPPAIGLSPTSLSFTAQQGSGNPAAQTVTISNTGGGTLTWSANDSAAWLALSPASGTGNGAVTLTASTGSLTAGSYSGSVTVSATGATPVTIPVAFTVTPAPVPPAIGLSPTSLSFTAQQGSGNPAAQTVTISNTGGGTLTWSANDSAAWLALSPASGTGNGAVTLTASTGSLTAGSYSGSVTVSATGATPVTIPVAFTVTPAPVPPAIGLSPTSLSFTAQQGSGNPAAQTVTISNTGGGTLTWSANDSAAWLALSPASGTGNGAVTLTASTGSLTAGSYSGSVTVSATGATPVTIPVAFTVTPAPVPPAIGLSPTSLSFTAQQGSGNPAAQTVTISNTGGGTLTWSANDSAAWLALSPASGTGNGAVTLTASTGSLTAGSYSGSVTVSATGATPVTIPVAFTVTPAPVPPAIGLSPTSLSFTAQQGSGNPAAQTVTISNTGGGTLTWSANDSAAWLALSPASGTGNGAVTLTASTGSLTAGSYSGSVTVSATGATPVTIPVAFTVTPAPVPPAIGLSPTSLSFTAQQGSGNPAAQTVTISNTGGGTLTWSANDSAAWLALSPASGTGNGAVTLTASTGSLTAGSYSGGSVTVSATGATPVTIPVAFTVTPAPVPPAIGLSPTSLSFTAQQGSGNPAAQTVTISNTGGGTLTWSANDSAAWLALSPASGTGNGAVTLTASTGSLTAGSYSGSVTVSATGATPVTIPVAFTVTAPPPQPTISFSPSSIGFTGTAGSSNPASKTIVVTNSGTGTLTWTATDNANWLTLSQSGSSLIAAANIAGLAAGNYSGVITITASGATNTPRTVPVTLTLTAPPPTTTGSATLTWQPNTEPDLAGYKVYRATSSGGYGAPIATLQGNTTQYVSSGLQQGTTYFFVVTAYDRAGNESAFSAEVSKSIY
ncbi:MAG: hypothetical protein NTNFB02_03500 [Nitrospira sp.]